MNTTTQVVKSFRTIKEMLTDRKIDISKLNGYSDDELKLISENTEIFSFDVSETFTIIYIMRNKIKITDIKKITANYPENHEHSFLVVLKENPTLTNIKSFNELSKDIQVFWIKTLLFNISKHILVPKHEVVTNEEEVKKIMSDYQIKNKIQFPIILKDDAMARYLNLKSGQLVKITRPSPTAGTYTFYRVVV